jgi:ribonuclease Z
LFGLTILGNNSAIPAFGRHPTSQAVTYEDQVYLVDCGEGTQLQLSHYRVKRSKIKHIFISHLHGDHYFGLIGLLTSMGLLGREQPLYLYGHPTLKEIIDLQLKAADTTLGFPLHFTAITQPGVLVDSPKMEISCFAVQHRIPCWGFLFREKKHPRKLLPAKAIEAGIPNRFFHELQMGKDYVNEQGITIANSEVTLPASPGRTYAYSADTFYDESLVTYFAGANLLYHEATYLHELKGRALERFHTTAQQAGEIAEKSGVKKLLLGHFSSKYEDLSPLLREASSVFKNTEIAHEGVTYRIL